MKKILIALILIIFLIIFGFAGFVYMNNANDKSIVSTIDQSQVKLTLPTPSSTTNITPTANETLLRGEFIVIDSLHGGSGNIEMLRVEDRYYLIFKENVSIYDGPELYVYLSEKQDYANSFKTDKTLNIGRLKSQKGSQVYEITKEQFDKYNGAVIIWCKPFGVQVTRAILN